MKLILKKNLCLTIGVIIMFNLFGCLGSKFDKYISKDNQINLSMDYPMGWKYSETRGSYGSYAQVMFSPFRKGQKSSRAIIDVTVRNSSKVQGVSPTLDMLLGDLLVKRMQFKDAKVLSKTTLRLLNTNAIVVELSYSTLENLLNVNSKLISVREKVIIFKLGNNFYFLRYENSNDEFGKYNLVFMHMIGTITFNN